MDNTTYQQLMKEAKNEFNAWLREQKKARKETKAKGRKIRQATLDKWRNT